jgi:hypothetical protein
MAKAGTQALFLQRPCLCIARLVVIEAKNHYGGEDRGKKGMVMSCPGSCWLKREPPAWQPAPELSQPRTRSSTGCRGPMRTVSVTFFSNNWLLKGDFNLVTNYYL